MNRKPVLITAAAGGLGKAFASECAARSWDLVLVDINRSALPPLASGLRRMFNIGVQTVTCDLTNPDERAMLWKQVKDRAGNLRGLINVAGLEFEGMFRERSLEEVRAILRLNVEATLENCLQGQALLSANEDAFIINTSSLAAVYPMPLKAVYAATKRLVYHFTLALHHELKKDRIHALALIPAGLPTHRASLQRIQSQGLLGQLTTTNVGWVAWRAIDRTLSGYSVYIPGFINRWIYWLSALVPDDLAAAFIQRRFSTAWKKRRRQDLNENNIRLDGTL